jgi:hypothetical protein
MTPAAPNSPGGWETFGQIGRHIDAPLLSHVTIASAVSALLNRREELFISKGECRVPTAHSWHTHHEIAPSVEHGLADLWV